MNFYQIDDGFFNEIEVEVEETGRAEIFDGVWAFSMRSVDEKFKDKYWDFSVEPTSGEQTPSDQRKDDR